ncbi:MAG: hypothetical protein IEMM0008_0548 [bacterium]|nr:MAG: hypothetical protein IEMM0008_0548 [bacterium]
MIISGLLSIVAGLYALYLVFQGESQWLLPSTFFLGLGYFIILETLSSWLEDENILYHSSSSQSCSNLFRIKKDTKSHFLLTSTMSKLKYYILPLTGILIFIGLSSYSFYQYVHLSHGFYWLSSAVLTFIIGLLYWIACSKLYRSKAEEILFDKIKKLIYIQSPVQRNTQSIPFDQIRRVIINNSKAPKKVISSFYNTTFLVYIETFTGKKKLIEKGFDKVHIQNLARKLWETLNVDIVDLSFLNLSSRAQNTRSAPQTRSPWNHITYVHDGTTESFSWRTQESFSTLILEIFFFILAVSSLLYSIETVPMPRFLDICFILSGVILILAILFVRNHFGYEYFIFTEEGVLYQYRLMKWVLQEKKLKHEEVKSAIFLFDDAVLEGESHYLIGNISRLSFSEKKWLKRKWFDRFHFPDSLELERNLVRFS